MPGIAHDSARYRFGVRPRLTLVFVSLFVLTLLASGVGVIGLRHAERAFGEFEARLMPEIAKVLELAERVAQLAAVAPATAETPSLAAYESDRATLGSLLAEIRSLAASLPARAGQRLAAAETFTGLDRELASLIALSHRRHVLRESFRQRLATLAEVGDRLLEPGVRRDAQHELLQSLWGSLAMAAASDDDDVVGRAEADCEALWASLERFGTARLQTAAIVALRSLSLGDDSMLRIRRQIIRTERELTTRVQLTRSRSETLGQRAGAYVAELHESVRRERDSVQATVQSGTSTMLLFAAVAIATAVIGLGYANRLLRNLQSITRVITRLAAGDTAQQTPATEHRNELGDLARAFHVFRGTLFEKERLAREQLAAQARLNQMQRMDVLGQLAGSIAHDFNNYLQPILGNLELLDTRVAHDPEAAAWTARARRSAEAAARLAQRLLAFARPQPAELTVFSLNEMLDEMADLIEFSAGTTVEVAIAARAEAPSARADRAQFESAVLNLVLNAAAALPAGGRIEIATMRDAVRADVAPPGPAVGVRVVDNGTGMPAPVLEKAFEPFFTTKERGKGNGLGLSIVQAFARQSGGSVVLASEPGRGTSVEIWLPACALPQAATLQAAPAGRRWAGTRLLLVDDDPEVLATVASLLGELGVDVTPADDAATAWDRWSRDGPFALVLTDVELGPGGDGITLARRIADDRRGQRVVLMSGRALAAAAAQRFAFMRKPFGRQQLADLLERELPS